MVRLDSISAPIRVSVAQLGVCVFLSFFGRAGACRANQVQRDLITRFSVMPILAIAPSGKGEVINRPINGTSLGAHWRPRVFMSSPLARFPKQANELACWYGGGVELYSVPCVQVRRLIANLIANKEASLSCVSNCPSVCTFFSLN